MDARILGFFKINTQRATIGYLLVARGAVSVFR
jgi:hypothetical protein